jgi:hypothetical protein
MKQPEVVLRDLVRQWFAKAETGFLCRGAARKGRGTTPLSYFDQYEMQRDNIHRFGPSYLALQSFAGGVAPVTG